MGYTRSTLLLLTVTSQVFAAPQLITFKDGKVGVNFGGYHAAAGLGGLLGDGAAGGLFAEAGTPHGQSARAGLGGATSGSGSGGGLYAGATAGGNVRASAGLAGGVEGERSGGLGFAGASAGNRHASAGLGGDAGVEGSSGFTYSSSKSFGVSGDAIAPIKPVHKKVHTEFNFDAANEVNSAPIPNANAHTDVVVETKVKPAVVHEEIPEAIRQHKSQFQQQFVLKQSHKVKTQAPVIVEKHYIEPQPVIIEKHIIHPQPVVIEKRVHHKRPHRYHNKIRVHGYVGENGAVAPPSIDKRIDVGVESSANAGAVDNVGAGQVSYTKQVNFQRNPQFFADIFNIPISTLRAVGSFLGNAAGSTSVSVQKSATVQGGAESDPQSPNAPSSQAQLSVQTPDASKFINDIFAIPINTLGAVNKFLENNVPRRVQVASDGEEPARFRLGRNTRRGAKQVFIETPRKTDEPKES